MKLAALFLSTALLSGCASVICTESNMVGISTENTRLLESKVKIDSYLAGKPMPDESFSRIQRSGLLSARVGEYNKAVDVLNYRANQFNTTCIKGKNGGL